MTVFSNPTPRIIGVYGEIIQHYPQTVWVEPGQSIDIQNVNGADIEAAIEAGLAVERAVRTVAPTDDAAPVAAPAPPAPRRGRPPKSVA